MCVCGRVCDDDDDDDDDCQYEGGVQAMQASKRMAEETPSSSTLELLLLNLLALPLLH